MITRTRLERLRDAHMSRTIIDAARGTSAKRAVLRDAPGKSNRPVVDEANHNRTDELNKQDRLSSIMETTFTIQRAVAFSMASPKAISSDRKGDLIRAADYIKSIAQKL